MTGCTVGIKNHEWRRPFERGMTVTFCDQYDIDTAGLMGVDDGCLNDKVDSMSAGDDGQSCSAAGLYWSALEGCGMTGCSPCAESG
jgi:hypothetical protein